MRPARAFIPVLLLTVLPASLAAQLPAETIARVDAVFEDYGPESPGCAVAVDRNRQTILSRAYGLAELEHGVANSPETIFEAGSVSKQFTAAAIILLALDGKLSLDDDVRKYVPELPDYGQVITIQHMMNHISGLRDWGSVAGIAGWPRTSRVHTHAHVVDILSRQRGVNFPPGQEYSYSNSGYNLQAVIVSRVSGMSFAEFSKQRIFEPLGMHNTQWRDDFERLVPGRAQAYSGGRGGFRLNMPFENVHGNGGLLTTVGDMLIWTRNLETGEFGGPQFLEMMHKRGVLTNGEQIGYASGLQFGNHRDGVPRISHTGSTAGYRAFLGRYPDHDLAVALLCNISSANPGGLGGDVADVFLPPRAEPEGGRGGRGGRGGGGRGGRGGAEPEEFTLTPAQLQEYAGEYYSPDVEITLRLYVEDGTLYAFRRPDDELRFDPEARDVFDAQSLGDVTFYRDAAGRITQFGVRQSRVYDLRFDRVPR